MAEHRVGHVPWYKRRARHWEYLRYVPVRNLASLYLAVFFLFSIFGFYQSLIAKRPYSLFAVFTISAVNGAYSVLYPYILSRKPAALLILVGILHGPLAASIVFGAAAFDRAHPSLVLRWPATRLFDANAIWFLVFISYLFFISFIRGQARDALRMQNELELAQGIQKTLVPPVEVHTAEYDVYGVSRPSERVGGDLVDVVSSANGTIAYVADVAGHGLSAGILMGMLKTATRTALLEPLGAEERLPALFHRLDRVLPEVKERQMYATFAALEIMPAGHLRFALAAHPPLLHYTAENRSVAELSLSQLPIGLVTCQQYVSQAALARPGDLFAIVTDGILETCNAAGEEFGLARTKDLLAQHCDVPLPRLAGRILDAVQAFGKQVDDQTLLLVRWNAPSHKMPGRVESLSVGPD